MIYRGTLFGMDNCHFNYEVTEDIFYVDDVEKHHGIKVAEILPKLPTVAKFMKTWDMTPQRMTDVITELSIPQRDFLEYSVSGNIMVHEKAVTRRIYGSNGSIKKHEYNIYLRETRYVCVPLQRIADHIFATDPRFKPIADIAMHEERRYKDSIRALNLNGNVLVDDLNAAILFENRITLAELVELYSNPSTADKIITVRRTKAYHDGLVVIPYGEEDHLGHMYTDIRTLLEKDKETFMSRRVFHEPYKEGGDRYDTYSGEQQGHPNFAESANAKKVRKFFIK